MKLAIGVGILATIFCLPVGAQTISELAFDQVGAQTVLQAVSESAQWRNAPRPPSKRGARHREGTNGCTVITADAEIEDNINHGRTAFVTADIMSLRGGVPIRVDGEVVGVVGVAGLSEETDTENANTAAVALSARRSTD